jgi:uncharacterized protein (UPF0335 family)
MNAMNAQEVLQEVKNRTDSSLAIQNKVDQFLINKNEEETNMTIDYAKRLLTLELEIKGIKDDQKEIKAEAKANGVAVMKVNKVLTNLKKLAKVNDADLSEIETIEGILANDVDIKTMISQLTQK